MPSVRNIARDIHGRRGEAAAKNEGKHDGRNQHRAAPASAPGHALIFVMGLLLLVGMTGARAQTPPSPSEIAAYTGLHKAVAAGDLAETAKLIATRPDLEARDGNGRTPLHVAAFCRTSRSRRRW